MYVAVEVDVGGPLGHQRHGRGCVAGKQCDHHKDDGVFGHSIRQRQQGGNALGLVRRRLVYRRSFAVEHRQRDRGRVVDLRAAGERTNGDLDGFVPFLIEVPVDINLHCRRGGVRRYRETVDGGLVVAASIGGSGEVQSHADSPAGGRIEFDIDPYPRVPRFLDIGTAGDSQRHRRRRRRRRRLVGASSAATRTEQAQRSESCDCAHAKGCPAPDLFHRIRRLHDRCDRLLGLVH